MEDMTYTATPQSRRPQNPRINTRPGPPQGMRPVRVESVANEEHADGERKYNLTITAEDGATVAQRVVGIPVKYLRVLERDERELDRRTEMIASGRKADIPGNRDQWIGGATRKVEITLARIAEGLGALEDGQHGVLEQVGGRDVFLWDTEGLKRPVREVRPKRRGGRGMDRQPGGTAR